MVDVFSIGISDSSCCPVIARDPETMSTCYRSGRGKRKPHSSPTLSRVRGIGSFLLALISPICLVVVKSKEIDVI